jgi:hypothetical protein
MTATELPLLLILLCVPDPKQHRRYTIGQVTVPQTGALVMVAATMGEGGHGEADAQRGWDGPGELGSGVVIPG